MIAYLMLLLLPLGHALFNTIVRGAQRQGSRILLVGATNYVVACLLNAGLAVAQGPVHISTATWLLAVPAGLVYAAAFRIVGISMGRRGLAVPSAIMQLALIVPLGLSVLLWGERPDVLQMVGIVLALAALALLALGKAPEKDMAAQAAPLATPILFLLFLLQGLALTAPKAFSELAPVSEAHIFLTLLFGTAALTFLPHWLGPLRPRRSDLLWGAALGAANATTNLLTVHILQWLPGILVYPVSTAGALVITSAIGLWAWKEPVGRWGKAGMVVALVTVVLVTVRG